LISQACSLSKERIWFESTRSLAFSDGFPNTEGHALVISKRRLESAFDLPPDELDDLIAVLGEVRALLKEYYQPDAFNIGVNDGPAAGQTVLHAMPGVHLFRSTGTLGRAPVPKLAGASPDNAGAFATRSAITLAPIKSRANGFVPVGMPKRCS
jgi:hypothetical protein